MNEMDLREKLVQLIAQAAKENKSLVGELADHLIDHGVTVQEWIPVTERLPEKSGQYIVCCDDSGCPYGEGIWYQVGVVVCAEVDVGI